MLFGLDTSRFLIWFYLYGMQRLRMAAPRIFGVTPEGKYELMNGLPIIADSDIHLERNLQ